MTNVFQSGPNRLCLLDHKFEVKICAMALILPLATRCFVLYIFTIQQWFYIFVALDVHIWQLRVQQIRLHTVSFLLIIFRTLFGLKKQKKNKGPFIWHKQVCSLQLWDEGRKSFELLQHKKKGKLWILKFWKSIFSGELMQVPETPIIVLVMVALAWYYDRWHDIYIVRPPTPRPSLPSPIENGYGNGTL